MQRFTDSPEATSLSTVTSEAEWVSPSAEAGERLDRAQSADHAWRADLVLGLHRRLQWLRRFDRGVQWTGAGVGGLLLLAAIIVLLTSLAKDPLDVSIPLVMSLLAGAVGTSAGGLGLVGVLGWCQEHTRRWIVGNGWEEQLEVLERAASTPVLRDWTCEDCRTENLGSASTCALCGWEWTRDASPTRPPVELLQIPGISAERLNTAASGLLAAFVFFLLLWCFLMTFKL